MRVHVAFTPDEEAAAPVGIVVDVLRATSTITQALAAGYRRILCCTEIEDARRLRGEIEGSLVGVMADAEFEEIEVDLAPGDTIVLYTDGLTDARAPEHLLAVEDLLRELEACKGQSAASITARLDELAAGPRETPPRDDIAIVVVKLSAG